METTQESISPLPTPVMPTPTRRYGFRKLLIFAISGFLAIILVLGVGFYLWKISEKESVTQPQVMQVQTKQEVATRTIFKNSKPSIIIKEESKRYPDGSLETKVSSNNTTLSHHLYLKDKILKLSNGILTSVKFKFNINPNTYLTTGENILNLISKTPNLIKANSKLNGQNVIVYTIGSKQKTGFELIKSAFAQADQAGGMAKIYIGEEDQQLKKIETIEPSSSNVIEEIAYEEGPKLIPAPLEPKQLEPSPLEPSPLEPSPSSMVSESPISVIEFMERQAEEEKEIIVDPSIVPTDQPISLFPLSVIPVNNEKGYNSFFIDVTSKAFGIHQLYLKILRDTGFGDPNAFVKQYVKVRVDGIEIVLHDFNISVDILYSNSPAEETGLVRFILPPDLQPGYHIIEVFAIDKWYLAPNLMVTLPDPNEATLQLELTNTLPPTAYALPNNQGYNITLSGKNLIKPFTVTLTTTQGLSTTLDDSNVVINGTDELVLNIPPSISPGIYSLTITKGSQTIYRPNYVAITSQLQ